MTELNQILLRSAESSKSYESFEHVTKVVIKSRHESFANEHERTRTDGMNFESLPTCKNRIFHEQFNRTF